MSETIDDSSKYIIIKQWDEYTEIEKSKITKKEQKIMMEKWLKEFEEKFPGDI